MDNFMKTIFSSISRLIFSYSKFLLMLTVLSTFGSFANASDDSTYLKCGKKYVELTGSYLKTNYNIRTKKFSFEYKVYSYGENYITFGSSKLNRNNGEWLYKGKVIRTCKKIHWTELPKLNEEGKLF